MKVKLVIGLGNPGKEYEKTYHNVGVLFIDYLVKSRAYCQLLKSDVYMNQSGNFVKAALKKYNFKPEEILIVHDDSDIELGKYKISFGRGSAGHRGVESIIKSIGIKNFWRLRIGIRKEKKKKAADLVLKKINKKDLEIFEKVFQSVIASVSEANPSIKGLLRRFVPRND